MVRNNNMVPRTQLHKDWQRWIKTHFDQPAKAKKRALKRRARAKGKAPRPLRKLRPIVQCGTQRHNMRARMGRGFTPMELKRVGIDSPQYARTIGIAVDMRRKNRSSEHMERNLKRLREYLGNLVLFPVEPMGKDRDDKEKMVAFLTAQHQAKLKMAGHRTFLKTPMRYMHKRKHVQMVRMAEVPDYDVWGTQRNEWKVMKKHFRWRRRDIRHRWKRAEMEAKAAKKAAKGK